MRSGPRKGENIAWVAEMLRQARRAKAKLVAFPENFTFFAEGGSAFRRGIESVSGPTVTALRHLARDEGLWVLAGGIPLWPGRATSARRATNASLLIDGAGRIKARYDKIHLFDATVRGDRSYQESADFVAGKKPVLAKTPWGKLGMSVCFDLRFPDLYRSYSARGAAMLSIPAAFTKVTGAAHWDVLTRARAVENQCFVLCPAQWGKPQPGRETYGHTRIIDPWGRVLADAGPRGQALVVADLDFAELKRVRAQLPVL